MGKNSYPRLALALAALAMAGAAWFVFFNAGDQGYRGEAGVMPDEGPVKDAVGLGTSVTAPQAESTEPKRHRIEGSRLGLDATLERGGKVVGRVLERGSGSAIAGAEVQLIPSANGLPSDRTRTATTDASGRYRFDGVAMGRYVALPEAQGYYLPQLGVDRPAPSALTVVMTADGHEVQRDLELTRGFSVSGRVVDAAGTGIEGATIHARGYGLHTVGGPWGLGALRAEPLAKSDVGGGFTVDGLPPKSDWVLYARKNGYAGVYGAPFASGEEAETPALVLQLTAEATIRGTLVDDAGQPVAGMQVNYSGPSEELAYEEKSAKSGREGTFELTGVPPRSWTLLVSGMGRQGQRAQVEDLEAGEVREGVVIQLVAGVEVSGVVVDQEGEPIPGLELMLQFPGGMNETVTAQDGSFTFRGVKGGRCQFFTWSAGAVGTPFDAPAANLRLETERVAMVRIHGEVLGPDGDSIPLCSVSIRTEGGGWAEKPTPMGGGGMDALGGTFEQVVPGPGPWTVTVSCPKNADGQSMNLRRGVAEVTDPMEKVVIRLERGKELSGVVVDQAGAGLADVVVSAGRLRAATDAHGRFRFSGLGDGPLTVQATPPSGFAWPQSVKSQAGASDVRIVLVAGRRIAGRVLDAEEEPAKGGWASGSWPALPGVWPGTVDTKIEPDGSFVLEGIPDGVLVKVQVQAWNPSGGANDATTVIENVLSGTEDLEVRMGSGLTIAGSVLGLDGNPVGGCHVSAVSVESQKQTGYVRVGEDGQWKVRGLEPGRYSIRVTHGGAAQAAVEVDAGATGVRLTLPKSATLAGRVEGRPPSGERWMVTVVDAEGTRLASGSVQEDGTWSIDAVRDGERVWVHATANSQAGYAKAGPVMPGREDVVLRVETGRTITGRIEDLPASASSLTPAWVSANGQRGWRSTGSVKPDGTFVIFGLPPGTYTVEAWTYGSDYQGEVPGVSDGAEGVTVSLQER